jgi:hypothetical protein
MKKLFVVMLICGFLFNLAAESLEEKVEKFGEENGKNYLQPFVSSMGANLNSGIFSSAKVLNPWHVAVYFNAMLAFVPEEAKKFTAQRPDISDNNGNYLYQEEEIESATVWGSQGGTFTINSAFQGQIDNLRLPNGAKLSAVPLMVPQFHLGLPAGNELMLRYFPKMEVSEKTGEISFLGIGLKHSLNKSILKLLPVDFAIQATFQQFKVGNILEMNSFNANGQVSKRLLMWTLYGGLGYETSELNANYKSEQYAYNDSQNQFQLVPVDVKFSLKGENDIRATIGVRYSFLLAKLYADYSVCKYPVLNLGIGLAL